MQPILQIFNKYLEKLVRNWKERGILGLISYASIRLKEYLKFRHFDVDGNFHPSQLYTYNEATSHANGYQASNYFFFKKVLSNLKWPYQESTFVDFGCGKGAALIYASELGFKKLIGIEFSSRLAEIAVKNLQKLSSQRIKKVNFEIVNIDASQYEIPSDANVFYFFNPFDAYVLDLVMQNIQKSLLVRQREIVIVYMNAFGNHIIEKYPFKIIRVIEPTELLYFYKGGAYVYKSL